jgi:hypothetical protein
MAIIKMNTNILVTLLGNLTIEDDDGNRIRFDIMPNQESCHTVCLNDNMNREIKVEDFEDCMIRIATGKLKTKTNYHIKFTSALEYIDSDERLFTCGIIQDDKMLAISFPDPNEDTKLFLGYNYTEDDLSWYNIEFENNEANLRVLDYKQRFIYLSVAWIWGVKDHFEEHETAVTLWTWWV